MKTNEQMELGLGKARPCPSVKRRQRQMSRANWWFDRMRERILRHAPEIPPLMLTICPVKVFPSTLK